MSEFSVIISSFTRKIRNNKKSISPAALKIALTDDNKITYLDLCQFVDDTYILKKDYSSDSEKHLINKNATLNISYKSFPFMPELVFTKTFKVTDITYNNEMSQYIISDENHPQLTTLKINSHGIQYEIDLFVVHKNKINKMLNMDDDVNSIDREIEYYVNLIEKYDNNINALNTQTIEQEKYYAVMDRERVSLEDELTDMSLLCSEIENGLSMLNNSSDTINRRIDDIKNQIQTHIDNKKEIINNYEEESIFLDTR